MENGYIILADPKGKGWNFAEEIYKNLKVNGQKFELGKINVEEFNDGEVKPKIQNNVRGKVCFFVHDSNKDPSRWFTDLCLVNQALEKSSALKIVDVFPYLRFARQDRKDESRVPISARVVADVVDLYADGVLTVDVHNPAIDGFFKSRFDNLRSFPTTAKYILEHCDIDINNAVVMSPDAGGASRAEAFAKRIGIKKVVIGYKVRKTAGEIESLKITGDVDGKEVLIVDDIVDSGGTLVKASNAAREMGAKKVYAYCTHALFTKGVDFVLDKFDGFFVGDTLSHPPHEKLKVIPFAPLFAEAIYRMSTGASLSELFD